MKTLLQINTVVNSGSTGRIAEEIGQLIIQNGWNSFIAYGRNKRPSESVLIKIGTRFEIMLHWVCTRMLDKHGLGSLFATKNLIREIEKINPDIIHLHNLHGYYLNYEVLFKYLANNNTPVVWTLHDCWPLTGHCAYFSFIECEKWKTHCNTCPQKSSYPSSILADRSKTTYQLKKELFTSVKNMTIVPVSIWLSDIVGQSYLSKLPVQIISNGVNLDVFLAQNNTEAVREKYGIGKRFLLLGIASIWSPRKGLEDYVKLSRLLSDDCIILLVGLSKAQLKTLPKTIIGLPHTENSLELSKLYTAADLVLNLSSEESFGLTTVEGFACGTPSIVYNCTASPELITPDTGFVVEYGDVLGLIEAINTVRKKGKESFSLACREQARRLYDKNNRYMDYLYLYESLLP